MAPILGYWDIRGLATPIRFLLEYVGADYDEKLYTAGPPPNFERPEWLGEKFNLGLDFPNLPYYIDGEIKLTQSGVILEYLAKKHGLAGKTEEQVLRAKLLDAQVRDYNKEYTRIAYNPQFLELKEDYLKTLPDKMKMLANFLGDRKFATGDDVTYADFVLFEFLEGQSYFKPDLLKDFPVLDQFHRRVLALPAINKYVNSSKFIKFPFNGSQAFIGGKYSEELMKKKD